MEIAQSLQQIESSYIREILAAATDSNVISLAGGLPDEQTFPIELMQATFENLVKMPEVFQYGTTAGYAPLLQHLRHRFQLPDTHSAVICTGSQQGLDLIARAYINPNDTVVMEAPSYLGAMQVFGLVQANIVTVSQTNNGPNINLLEQCFIEHQPKMFYAVPDFHNPTGICWNLETRQKVAALCEQYQVTLIEDAPYRDLRFAGDPLPQVSDFCPQNSIVLRSFSKIASPGLRVGVVTGKHAFINPLIKVKQGADLHSSVPMQAVLLGLLEHPDFEQHLEKIRALYQSRYQVLFAALQEHLPACCSVKPVEGGMFIWLTHPQCDTFALAQTLLANGVAVVPSPVFYPDTASASAGMRLNFTNAQPEQLTEAVKRISDVLKATLV